MTDCRVCLKPFVPWPMGEKEGFAFIACKACGSVMLDPFPSQPALDAFFEAFNPKAEPAKNPLGEIMHARKCIARAAKHHPGRRFLDVCSRQGYAVMAARELGYDARGIDVHEFFVRFAQEQYGAKEFSRATAHDYAAAGGQADIIFSSGAFCEQLDPDAFTAALAKILTPGGRLYIEEPDGNSMWLPKEFMLASFVAPPVNFIYLSFPGMQQLLARHGLKIAHKFFTWTPYMRLVVTK